MSSAPSRNLFHLHYKQFWTDYSVLQKAATEQEFSIGHMIQVVGHSIGNTIRTSNLMQSIGIDSGMYIGGRSFLQVNTKYSAPVVYWKFLFSKCMKCFIHDHNHFYRKCIQNYVYVYVYII